ncbi:DivIVA domain-containing protein [Brevibacterium zhoupengii]|uniref:DivIVA domain-containing protein n=1 Tax=Brevibacterium zhoupengii TaxID=2898795 RepID=UPI001E4ADD22|nr:DivIVA domain-containing protein [Brevibacterium zhoupengii]
MPLWIVIGVAAAIFVLVIVLAATFNVFSAESAEEAEADWQPLPEDFTSEDLEGLSFRPALRGYRMEDVDSAVAALRTRITELEAAREQQ